MFFFFFFFEWEIGTFYPKNEFTSFSHSHNPFSHVAHKWEWKVAVAIQALLPPFFPFAEKKVTRHAYCRMLLIEHTLPGMKYKNRDETSLPFASIHDPKRPPKILYSFLTHKCMSWIDNHQISRMILHFLLATGCPFWILQVEENFFSNFKFSLNRCVLFFFCQNKQFLIVTIFVNFVIIIILKWKFFQTWNLVSIVVHFFYKSNFCLFLCYYNYNYYFERKFFFKHEICFQFYFFLNVIIIILK